MSDPVSTLLEEKTGMTLRDHFAGQAMQSFILGAAFNHESPEYKLAAEESYVVADEMLKARSR